MKFKTDASCGHCKATILKAMQAKFPNAEWNLDLEHADKILEVHGLPENAENAAMVEKTLEETGFKGTWLPGTGY
ncbi:MAG: heavy metal transport/detoxification protein [Bacteroides sp.]|nr:heavy metal transport/detoxification protein [Bacteroidales bacterium]MBD5303021.1 heavy metal transport/detoxification protein [Bacteroides sp.]MBD5304778.1 heavy metal transport/detoxification protein [Bacteroides sp.]MBD5349234.1 heavy metal transport/detoxification protein [Bacteroides sp.]